MTSKQLKIGFSFAFGVLIGAIVLGVLLWLKDPMAWISTALGLATGWALGILAAPYQSEQARFKTIGNVAAGFVTGYAVSKVDRLFDLWVDPGVDPIRWTRSERWIRCPEWRRMH